MEGLSRSRLPEFTAREKELNKGTSDFFCINTYWSGLAQAIPEPPVKKPPNKDSDCGVRVIGNGQYRVR